MRRRFRDVPRDALERHNRWLNLCGPTSICARPSAVERSTAPGRRSVVECAISANRQENQRPFGTSRVGTGMNPTHRIHIALPVSNLEESIAFYRTLLGTEPSKTKSDYAKFETSEPAIHLALNSTSEPIVPQRDPYHFGVQLTSAAHFDKLRNRVTTAGLAGKREDSVTCCYAVSNKLWLLDPDGHRWELFHTLADADTHRGDRQPAAAATPSGERSCCAPTCCQP